MKMVYLVALLFCCILQLQGIGGCGHETEAGSVKTVAGALLYGGWRTCKVLIDYSNADKRNTLIVEMHKHSSLTIPKLQRKRSYGRINSLVGMAAICIYLRDMEIRSIKKLKRMSDHDQRNTLIVELHKNLGQSVSSLQAKGDLALVRLAVSKMYKM